MSSRRLVDALRWNKDGKLQVWVQRARLGGCGGIDYSEDGNWVDVPTHSNQSTSQDSQFEKSLRTYMQCVILNLNPRFFQGQESQRAVAECAAEAAAKHHKDYFK